jgi:hypothetical protein
MRQLWRMAYARRMEDWDRVACLMAAQSFEKVNPQTLNPIRRAEVERLRKKVYKNGSNRAFFTALGLALGDKEAVKRWQSTATEKVEEGAEKSAPDAPTLS